MIASLYGDLLAAGVPIANHQRDLYFADTADSRAILTHWPEQAKLATRFETEPAGADGWKVPFAFLPWWVKRLPVVAEVLEPDDLKD